MASRVAALETAQVHVLDEFKADFAPRVKANPELDLFVAKPGNRLLGHFNHVRPPFNKREARLAVTLAYDAEKALRAGAGDPAFWRLCPNIIACGTRWETAAGSAGYYNAKKLAEARSLVEKAGVKGAKVRILQPLDMPVLPDAAEISREILKDIGFDVDLQAMDWATLGTRRTNPDLWEYFHTWSGVIRVVGPLIFPEFQYNAWFNKYQDEAGKQRDLFAKIARAPTFEEQFKLLEEFQKYFYEDAIFVQIGEFFPPLASRKEVKGFNPQPFPVFWGVWLEK
jgi:peptide/nickel transport system substrate-binding protein